MSNVKNMTSGSPGKLIFAFSLPLMAGNVFQQLYTIVDTMVVGQALGVNALAALGATDWLSWTSLGLIQGFTQGFGIQLAQRFGAGDHRGFRKSTGNSLLLSLILAVILLLAMQLAVLPVLNLLNTPAEIRSLSVRYLRFVFSGIPIVMAYNIFACILRALGDGRSPLAAMIIASLTNVGLDLLFVLVFGWGIAGAAAATILAQGISALYCIKSIRKIDLLKLQKNDFCPEKNLIRHLWTLGIPMAFQNMVISVGGMIVQSAVNGFGVIFIAGFTATNKLYGLLEIAATSYGFAVVTYTGQNMGAGQLGRIRSGLRCALGIAVITSIIIAAAMLLFGRAILGLFISGTPEETVSALEIAFRYLKIMSIFLPVLYFLHVVRSCIQGMGNTILPMLSGIAEFTMRTVAALLLPLLFGQSGIFAAEVLAWCGADIVLIISYCHMIRCSSTASRNS